MMALMMIAITVLGVGCAHRTIQTEDTAVSAFASPAYDVHMVYPADLEAARGFRAGYFLDRRWNPDAGVDVPGDGLLTLTLPGSNKLLTAQLRLGASDAGQALRDCPLPEDRSRRDVTSVVIDGVTFRRRDTADAAMNHFLARHAYRGVARGHCYALDLIVDGSNPGVYPDHPTPPMTRQEAFKRLTALLDGLSFAEQP